MCDLGAWAPESRFSVILIAGLQSERMASMFVCSCASRTRAIPSSSPSMCVALVPKYFFPDRSGIGSDVRGGLFGFEQKPPAALLSSPDPSVKAVV